MPASESITLCARRRRSVLSVSVRPVSLVLLAVGSALPACAADVEDCRELFLTGRYEKCRDMAAKALADHAWGESWHLLLVRSELAAGRLDAARTATDAALKRYTRSIRIRLLAFEVFRHLGEPERARELLVEIDTLAAQAPWRYTGVDDLVALGRAALLVGADARDVLDGFYDRARRLDPDRREPYLAIGELALEKHDDQLAAETFEEAAKRIRDDADIHFGLARAYARGNAKRSAEELDKTLAINPRHVPALLFQVDGLIDSEKYAEADALLDRILEINPRRPEAWAYRAVLAHLLHDPKGEAVFHAAAQGQWKRDPAVEHLIGRKLSQHYRFKEGAAYQRRALEFDPSFDPARSQLAQERLRLGREEEGWELAETAHKNDGYEVTTFNLLELRDRIAKFRTLENEHFLVRMDAREAAIYGGRVLDLLDRARRTLCEKYELDLTGQITVEIFPDENDFAVRTFGLPAVSGYLGVCFGRVITANSPASQGEHPSNWEAVLWHEFC
ncbi:MAG: tetratricopeptide repeat protein, partial [Planctomycetaceae bacterium]